MSTFSGIDLARRSQQCYLYTTYKHLDQDGGNTMAVLNKNKDSSPKSISDAHDHIIIQNFAIKYCPIGEFKKERKNMQMVLLEIG